MPCRAVCYCRVLLPHFTAMQSHSTDVLHVSHALWVAALRPLVGLVRGGAAGQGSSVGGGGGWLAWVQLKEAAEVASLLFPYPPEGSIEDQKRDNSVYNGDLDTLVLYNWPSIQVSWPLGH